MATPKQLSYIQSLYGSVSKIAPTLTPEQSAMVADKIAPFKPALVKVMSNDDIDYKDASALIPTLKGIVEGFTTEIKWRKQGDIWCVVGSAEQITVGATVTVTSSRGEQSVTIASIAHTDDAGRVYGIPAQDDKVKGKSVTEPGFYWKDSEIIEAYLTRNNQLVGRLIHSHGEKEYLGKRGLIGLDKPMTTEELAEFAAAWGFAQKHCMFCGKSLGDEGDNRSVEVGYGPKCAAKNGLPWG
jgi:hypothetical protein